MAKNKVKSENLLNSIARIEFLLEKGFTKSQLAEMSGIKLVTFSKISRGLTKDIKPENHNKIKKMHSDYIQYMSNLDYEEDVIDEDDVEEGVKEVTSWLIIAMILVLICLVGLGFAIKFVMDLF